MARFGHGLGRVLAASSSLLAGAQCLGFRRYFGDSLSRVSRVHAEERAEQADYRNIEIVGCRRALRAARARSRVLQSGKARRQRRSKVSLSPSTGILRQNRNRNRKFGRRPSGDGPLWYPCGADERRPGGTCETWCESGGVAAARVREGGSRCSGTGEWGNDMKLWVGQRARGMPLGGARTPPQRMPTRKSLSFDNSIVFGPLLRVQV